MEMLVRILGVGSEWWVRPEPDRSDPLRFTKHAAYFNTTAFPHGSKFRRSWKVPGVLRFNGNSGSTHTGPTMCFVVFTGVWVLPSTMGRTGSWPSASGTVP
jgi:hypothetical protein